jgi:hypothetical protein
VTRPVTFYQYNNSTWELQTGEYSDVVFGFFFANGVSDANKKVCKESSTATLTRLSSNSAGSPQMIYDPSINGAGQVNVYGGTTSCTLEPHKFRQDTISLTHHQFNGEGNNTAQSIHGAFSFKMNGSDLMKFTRNGNTFEFPTLPDIFGAGKLYNGIKLFAAATEPSSRDYLRCETTELTDMGFSEVSLTGTPTMNAASVSVTTSSALGTYLMVCPTKDGVMNAMGGHYIGEITPYALLALSHGTTFNFGLVPLSPSTTATMNLVNSGLQQATGINAPTLVAPITFVGGSFPGTGGTCGATLAAGATCSINIDILPPVASTSYTQPMIINYHDGHGTRVLNSSITGTSLP